MDPEHRKVLDAVQRTTVVRTPRQRLATFGVTTTSYFLVTEPVYRELDPGGTESVIREGKVVSERPTVVTPRYMAHLEGFGDNARKYLEYLAERYGPNSPGVLYRYRNDPVGLNIVAGAPAAVVQRIKEDLDGRGDERTAVIHGVDELWDASLLKFVYEFTAASLTQNVAELNARGLLEPELEAGVPRAAIEEIERLFHEVERGLDPSVLKRELDRWGLFHRYEDRFLALFHH
ncbi:MAG: hypothetical protein HY683_03080 [Chloroflexi bacterium]|nr:hypothetical protein [Chloroflexota bacterium]